MLRAQNFPRIYVCSACGFCTFVCVTPPLPYHRGFPITLTTLTLATLYCPHRDAPPTLATLYCPHCDAPPALATLCCPHCECTNRFPPHGKHHRGHCHYHWFPFMGNTTVTIANAIAPFLLETLLWLFLPRLKVTTPRFSLLSSG